MNFYHRLPSIEVSNEEIIRFLSDNIQYLVNCQPIRDYLQRSLKLFYKDLIDSVNLYGVLNLTVVLLHTKNFLFSIIFEALNSCNPQLHFKLFLDLNRIESGLIEKEKPQFIVKLGEDLVRNRGMNEFQEFLRENLSH